MYSYKIDSAYTIEEALQMAGHGKFQRKVMFVGGLIAMASFISVGTVSFIMTAAQCDLQMDSIQKGTLISGGFIGLSILVNVTSWRIDLLPSFVYKPWRLYYALSGVPSLTAAALLITLPESPMFLLANNDEKGSIMILKDIYRINSGGTEDTLPFLVKHLIIEEDTVVTKISDSNMNKTSMFFHSIWEQTVPLLRKPYRLKIALITALQFLLFLSNNCIFLWVPETVNRIGIYHRDRDAESMTFCEVVQDFNKRNTSRIDNDIEILQNDSTTSTSPAYSVSQQMCSEKINPAVYWTVSISGGMIMICLVMIHFAARVVGKKLIIGIAISCALASITLLIFAENPYLIIAEMCFFMMVSAAATQVVLYTVVDLFPTKIRSMAVCLAIMCCRFGSISSNLISGALIDNYCSLILVMMLVCLSVCLMITFFLPLSEDTSRPIQGRKSETIFNLDQKLHM
ncbi:uncharacterized protein LOC111057506 isoform X3 [Nilaparvata lugens]|uniref:uncharacterized protein LOC111057506 isoform X3 n=1 Tax=Nilaparvata lugens TaxID=108931 RepID=UPI00193D4423|nr:uncharacterized protein LOC111057506 isoform X3 [Nilaparvata lugens]